VKAHVAVNSDSLPLAIIVAAGNEHDSRRFEQIVSMYESILVEEGQKPDTERFWPMQLTILNRYNAIFGEEV
jgi:hypothetical protein